GGDTDRSQRGVAGPEEHGHEGEVPAGRSPCLVSEQSQETDLAQEQDTLGAEVGEDQEREDPRQPGAQPEQPEEEPIAAVAPAGGNATCWKGKLLGERLAWCNSGGWHGSLLGDGVAHRYKLLLCDEVLTCGRQGKIEKRLGQSLGGTDRHEVERPQESIGPVLDVGAGCRHPI